MTTWPFFWCLEPRAQALLMQYYYDNFGERLYIPPPLPNIPVKEWKVTLSESQDEIDRIMRLRPQPKRAGWRG